MVGAKQMGAGLGARLFTVPSHVFLFHHMNTLPFWRNKNIFHVVSPKHQSNHGNGEHWGISKLEGPRLVVWRSCDPPRDVESSLGNTPPWTNSKVTCSYVFRTIVFMLMKSCKWCKRSTGRGYARACLFRWITPDYMAILPQLFQRLATCMWTICAHIHKVQTESRG